MARTGRREPPGSETAAGRDRIGRSRRKGGSARTGIVARMQPGNPPSEAHRAPESAPAPHPTPPGFQAECPGAARPHGRDARTHHRRHLSAPPRVGCADPRRLRHPAHALRHRSPRPAASARPGAGSRRSSSGSPAPAAGASRCCTSGRSTRDAAHPGADQRRERDRDPARHRGPRTLRADERRHRQPRIRRHERHRLQPRRQRQRERPRRHPRGGARPLPASLPRLDRLRRAGRRGERAPRRADRGRAWRSPAAGGSPACSTTT